MKSNTKLTIVVSLRINRAREAEFEQFETAAAQIMRKYGGAIERRIRLATQAAPPPGSTQVVGPPSTPQADTPLEGSQGQTLKVERAESAPPDEIHIVTFPDAACFDRYRADPDLKTLATLRSHAIRATTVWPGSDLPPFGP